MFDGPSTFPSIQTGFQDAETLFSIANPDDDQAITLTLQFFTNGGFLDSEATRQLPEEASLKPFVRLLPNASFQIEVGTLFNIGPSVGSELITGSIQVDVDGPGLIGDVIFGDPGDPITGTPNVIDFVAALPLQTEGFTRAIFSQVANGSVDPARPSLDSFTGLALFNPNSGTAEVTIRVFDTEGDLVGERTLTLGVNERLSQLVETLVPESADLIGGYIEVVSDQPLIAQQFFGNNTLQFLSAVPPHVIE